MREFAPDEERAVLALEGVEAAQQTWKMWTRTVVSGTQQLAELSAQALREPVLTVVVSWRASYPGLGVGHSNELVIGP